jgi:predicted lipid-binding transport protein (Tim44 family)
MKISWNSLKISIAGARLSHLVQKDKIWDHGSMTEQARNIFYQVEKAKNRKELDFIKKYATPNAVEQLQRMVKLQREQQGSGNTVLTTVAVIAVSAATGKHRDRFTAFIKGKRMAEGQGAGADHGIENFSERWHFTRQGDWWVLDHIGANKNL